MGKTRKNPVGHVSYCQLKVNSGKIARGIGRFALVAGTSALIFIGLWGCSSSKNSADGKGETGTVQTTGGRARPQSRIKKDGGKKINTTDVSGDKKADIKRYEESLYARIEEYVKGGKAASCKNAAVAYGTITDDLNGNKVLALLLMVYEGNDKNGERYAVKGLNMPASGEILETLGNGMNSKYYYNAAKKMIVAIHTNGQTGSAKIEYTGVSTIGKVFFISSKTKNARAKLEAAIRKSGAKPDNFTIEEKNGALVAMQKLD